MRKPPERDESDRGRQQGGRADRGNRGVPEHDGAGRKAVAQPLACHEQACYSLTGNTWAGYRLDHLRAVLQESGFPPERLISFDDGSAVQLAS